MSRVKFHGAMRPPFPEDLLASGAMEGPARKTRPVTLTLRTRLLRWLRRINDHRSKT